MTRDQAQHAVRLLEGCWPEQDILLLPGMEPAEWWIVLRNPITLKEPMILRDVEAAARLLISPSPAALLVPVPVPVSLSVPPSS